MKCQKVTSQRITRLSERGGDRCTLQPLSPAPCLLSAGPEQSASTHKASPCGDHILCKAGQYCLSFLERRRRRGGDGGGLVVQAMNTSRLLSAGDCLRKGREAARRGVSSSEVGTELASGVQLSPPFGGVLKTTESSGSSSIQQPQTLRNPKSSCMISWDRDKKKK